MKFNSYLIFLFVLGLRLFAQEATEEVPQGWPIVERCVGEPIIPPDDWRFEGTILATGWAGIHGINEEWETPRILLFQDDWYPEQYGYGLSSSSEWYAVIQYDYIQQFPRSYIRTYGLKIYSTSNPELFYYYAFEEAGEETQVFWLDDEQLIYSIYRDNYVLNPFTGELNIYDGFVNDRMLISPDSHFAASASYRTIEWYFEDLSNHETLFVEREGYPTGISPDSELIAVHRRQEIEGEDYPEIGSVVFIHPNGELEDTVFVGTVPTSGLYSSFFYLTHGWSRDGRYYAFVVAEETSYSNGILHIADTQERIVINTCLSTINGGLAWSPNENKLVVGYYERGQEPLQILDLDLWQAYYSNQYHDGVIIGWRAD